MDIDLKKLGKQISRARDKKGISQKLLSEQLHISPTHLSNIERGKSMPSLCTFIDICTVLNTNSDFLLNEIVHPDLSDEIVSKFKRCNDDQKILISKIIDVFLELSQT